MVGAAGGGLILVGAAGLVDEDDFGGDDVLGRAAAG